MTLLAAALCALAAGEVAVQRHVVEPARLEAWRAVPDARPALRGFRAPILDRAGEPLRLALPDAERDPRASQAARTVASRLAHDGLRATLVAALQDLGPERAGGPDGVALLEATGFPVDLLAMFGDAGAEPLVRGAAAGLAAGRAADEVLAELDALPFAWKPTIPGWRVATESGETEPGVVRLQVSSATDYAAPGEGGAMDVLRGLARALPDAEIVASVEEKHAGGVTAEAQRLAAARAAPIRVLVEPLPLTQWAQDAAKPGVVERDGARSVVWLAARYASRGEDGSTFLPPDSLLLEGFAAAGHEVAVSPLLFQGGDVLPVVDARDGTRWLLVGEAEIARNRALGLTQDQVLAALRAELGADRCLVLPANSFHVDLEVSVRSTPAGPVVFVLDSSRAARIVIRCAVEALQKAGEIGPDVGRAALAALDADDHRAFFDRFGPVFDRHRHGPGAFGQDLARGLAAGPADSGVGNLQRFLLALDLWAAERVGGADPAALGIDASSWAYLESLRRRELDRARVAAALEGLGWRVVPVPGLSEGTRGLCTLNGLQVAGKFLQPAYGGIYAHLDRAARDVLEGVLGDDVEVVPVPCGETQRRAGGLHCAAAVAPRL